MDSIDYSSVNLEAFKDTFINALQTHAAFTSQTQPDDSIATFKAEYDKMFASYHRASTSIKRLSTTSDTLNKELRETNEAQTIKIQNSSALPQKDKIAPLVEVDLLIAQKKQEFEDRQAKELVLREKLKLLKMSISDLVASIKDGSQLSADQKSSLQELIDFKALLTVELEEEIKRMNALRIAIQNTTDRYKKSETEKQEMETQIIDLREQDTLKKSEIEKETKNKEICDKELKTLRTAVTSKQDDSKSKLEVVLRTAEDIALIHVQIKAQGHQIEQFQKEQLMTLAKTQRLQDESKDQIHQSEHLYKENIAIEQDIAIKISAYNHQRSEVKKVSKLRDEVLKKVSMLENQKNLYSSQKEHLKVENADFLGTIEFKRIALDELKKKLNDSLREGVLLDNMVQKSMVNSVRVSNTVTQVAQIHSNLEFDVQRHQKSIKMLNERVEQLMDNKHKVSTESIAIQTQVVTSVRLLKEREIQIYDFRKKMIGVERKLTQQQALYEAVLNDRNIHSKHLLESQTEVSQMKRKLKTIHYQISNYKEEIRSKVAASSIELTENKRLKEEIVVIEGDIEKLKHQNELSVIYIRKQTSEENSLVQFLKSAEMERSKQEQGLKILYSERDNLNFQLVQQNIKLSDVYEELRVGRSNERHYDLVQLKTTDHLNKSQQLTINLRQSRLELKEYTQDHRELKHLSSQLENELLIETIRSKALDRESKISVNIHPWRTIENSNAKLFDMIHLYNSLQKQLINKNQEEKDRELLIQSQEKLYLQLKSIYAMQVGPEAVEQIREFKEMLNEKRDTLKTLGIELKVGRAKTREIEYEIGKSVEALGGLKKMFIAKRLKESLIT